MVKKQPTLAQSRDWLVEQFVLSAKIAFGITLVRSVHRNVQAALGEGLISEVVFGAKPSNKARPHLEKWIAEIQRHDRERREHARATKAHRRRPGRMDT